MSENAGLQNGREPEVIVDRVSGPVARSMAIRRPNHEIQQRNKSVNSGFLYSPFTHGEMDRSRYRRVPRPTGERVWKKNPLMPAVSFVPVSVQLKEQPLLNVADPREPDPITEMKKLEEGQTNRIPDTTVISSIPESRQYRQQLRTVSSLLDTRANQRRLVRGLMDQAQPDRPQIVDIDKHRAHHMSGTMDQNALMDAMRQKMQGGTAN
jgi:hypothetical protein